MCDEGGCGGQLALAAPGPRKKCQAHHPERAAMDVIAGACILCAQSGERSIEIMKGKVCGEEFLFLSGRPC